MADTKLEVVLSAKDEASAKIKSLNTTMGNVATTIGKFTIGAAAAGIALAGVFIKKSIDAAKEEEVAMAKVEAIAKSMGFTMADLSPIIDEASKKAMQLGFDDEAAAIAMAKLMQVTGDEGVAMNALTLTMDLARYKNIDLDTAQQAVTMALGGSTKMLKQLGIEIPENVTKQEMLKLVLEKVGGQAKAYGDTFAGAQDKVKEAFEHVQEEIGEVFLPILTKLYNYIADFITSEKFTDFIDNLKTKIIAVGTNIKEIYDVMLPVFKDTFTNTFEITNELIRNMNGELDGIKGQFSAIDYVIGPIIGLILAVNKGLQIGAGIIMGFKMTVQAIADSFEGWILGLEAIANIMSKGPYETIKGLITGKQAGGYVAGGQPYMVGERGPELFMPSGAGQIVPNNKLGGAININFNNPVVRSENDLSRIISEVKRVLNREQVVAQLRI